MHQYGVMGLVKAALETVVAYLAAGLGPEAIRVHAISPDPLTTRAASGIPHFDTLLEQAASRAPLRHALNIDDVGALAAWLVSPSARGMTGNVMYLDAGDHLVD